MISTLQEHICIEEILTEAKAFGIRSELRDLADNIWLERKNDDEFTRLDAYHLAYNRLIK